MEKMKKLNEPTPKLESLAQKVKPGHLNDIALKSAKQLKNFFTEHLGNYNILVNSIGNLEHDKQEIELRQEITSALIKNPQLRQDISVFQASTNFPKTIDQFAQYLELETDFYRQIDSIVTLLQDIPSQRLDLIRQGLSDISKYQSFEQAFVQALDNESKNQYLFTGYVDYKITKSFSVNSSKESLAGFGFAKNPLTLCDFNNSKGVPTEIQHDISDYIVSIEKDLFNLSDFNELCIRVTYDYGMEEKPGLHLNITLHDSTNFHTTYKEKLDHKISQMQESLKEPGLVKYEPKSFKDRFSLWNAKKGFRLTKKSVTKSLTKSLKKFEYDSLKATITSYSKTIYGETSKQYGHKSYKGLIEQYKTEVETLDSLRNEFSIFISQLKNYVDVIDFLEQNKPKKSPSMIVPRVVEKNVLNLTSVLPIRLLGNKNINEILSNSYSLEGKPVIMTGPNYQGKSVYLITNVDMHLLTQEGFPIIANPKHAVLGIKDSLFMHKVEDGDANFGESTFYNSLIRIKDMFSEMQSYQRPHVVIDELGSGTDPDSASIVGLTKVIEPLSAVQENVSSVVSTQFQEIARQASFRKLATVLKVDNYRVSPGIATAKGDELSEKIGLTNDFIDGFVKGYTIQ